MHNEIFQMLRWHFPGFFSLGAPVGKAPLHLSREIHFLRSKISATIPSSRVRVFLDPDCWVQSNFHRRFLFSSSNAPATP